MSDATLVTHICDACLGDRTGNNLCGCFCPACSHLVEGCTCPWYEQGMEDFHSDSGFDSDSDSYTPYYTSPSHRAPVCDAHKPSGKADRNCHACEQLACDEEAKERAAALAEARKERAKKTSSS